jgi:hypothetical protein
MDPPPPIDVLILALLNSILNLDMLIQDSEVEFIASVNRHRVVLIQAFPPLRSQIDVTSLIPSFSAMISSMRTYELFHQGWEQCRDALHSAVLSCPALAEYHWMFLAEEGCIELIDAANALGDLLEVVGDGENSEDLFAMHKPQCHQTFTDAYECMEDDGHDMRGIELSYTGCLDSLESYAAFRAGAAASHAGIVAAILNQRVFAPFLGDLQPVM